MFLSLSLLVVELTLKTAPLAMLGIYSFPICAFLLKIAPIF